MVQSRGFCHSIRVFFSGMKPLSQSWYYWIMVGLFIAQIVLSVKYHALLCNMLTANTLLLLIISVHHGYQINEDAKQLFHRICGCVAFIAVLFVNCTHALESLSNVGDDGHGHSHSVEHEEHVDHYSFIPDYYAFVAIFDVILKCMILVLGYIPHMGLNLVFRILFHTITPLSVVIYYVLGLSIPTSIGTSKLWQLADPITTIILTAVLIGLIVPSFKEVLPYLLVHEPTEFEEDDFRYAVGQRFPSVTISHLHVYRQWPGKQFEALLHIDIELIKSSSNWSNDAAQSFQSVQQFVEEYLKQKGAKKIVIQPRFLGEYEDSKWQWCDDNCQKKNRGCCDKPAEEAAS